MQPDFLFHFQWKKRELVNPVQKKKKSCWGSGEMVVADSKYNPGAEVFAPLLHHQLFAAVSCLVCTACLVAPGLLKAALGSHGFATLWLHPSLSASPPASAVHKKTYPSFRGCVQTAMPRRDDFDHFCCVRNNML